MSEEGLLKRLSDSLFELCLEREIKLITTIELTVDESIQLKRNDFYLFLLEELPLFCGLNTKVIIHSKKMKSGKIKIKSVVGVDGSHSNCIVFNRKV